MRPVVLTIIALVVCAVAASALPPAVAASGTDAPDRAVAWLAAGDSYSSGEGIRQTTGSCARSDLAYGPRAASILRNQLGWEIDPMVFTACTGAVTTNFFNRSQFDQPPQSQAASTGSASGEYDVVTMSFGGNDVDFAKIMTDCIGLDISWNDVFTSASATGCAVSEDELHARILAFAAGHGSAASSGNYGAGNVRESIAQFYSEVADRHLRPGGILLVVGYPRIFAPSGQWPAWRHGRCGAVSARDADLLGRAAVDLDDVLGEAVRKASGSLTGDRSIRYVSRMTEFDNDGHSHSLCAPDTSWLNGLGALWYAGRVESPFHPNEVGHQVTAEAVAGIVERHWGDEHPAGGGPTSSPSPHPAATPTPTSTPTIEDGTSHYGIGDEFLAQCTVAWPTAPTYTSSTIELTMHCPAVPGQFLFVHVSYPDPGLPITPGTGMTTVHGQIVDIATSAYGYKELVVNADRIDLG